MQFNNNWQLWTGFPSMSLHLGNRYMDSSWRTMCCRLHARPGLYFLFHGFGFSHKYETHYFVKPDAPPALPSTCHLRSGGLLVWIRPSTGLCRPVDLSRLEWKCSSPWLFAGIYDWNLLMFVISPWIGQCHSLPSGLDNNNSILSCHIFHAAKWSRKKDTMPCRVPTFKCERKKKTQYFAVTAKEREPPPLPPYFLWSHFYCRDVKVFAGRGVTASLGPKCGVWSRCGTTLITMFLENVAPPQQSSENKGGNALWKAHNSPGMHGMKYLNCHLTCGAPIQLNLH